MNYVHFRLLPFLVIFNKKIEKNLKNKKGFCKKIQNIKNVGCSF